MEQASKWFADKQFTSDWTTVRLSHWFDPLIKFRDASVSVLEVGSFEGRSVVFFMEFLPKCKLTCIDPFFSSDTEKRFAANTAAYADRLEVMKDVSVPALERLRRAARRFDVVYIDGSHRRDDVLADSILAWPLLNVGGVLIWDDRRWKTHLPSADRPEHAIDLFCLMFSRCFRLHHHGYQVIIEKTAEWPHETLPMQLVRWPARHFGRAAQRARTKWQRWHLARR
jgi:hypothetical protein